MKETKIRVILVEPGKAPRLIETESSLEAMQQLVGGYIEQLMPFEDEVAIIVNEEGKLMGLPLNRGIIDSDGELIDIIAGTFFICYAPADSETFLSLPEELVGKYMKLYEYPEVFIMVGDKVHAIRLKT